MTDYYIYRHYAQTPNSYMKLINAEEPTECDSTEHAWQSALQEAINKVEELNDQMFSTPYTLYKSITLEQSLETCSISVTAKNNNGRIEIFRWDLSYMD
jgi:hypothetical protein